MSSRSPPVESHGAVEYEAIQNTVQYTERISRSGPRPPRYILNIRYVRCSDFGDRVRPGAPRHSPVGLRSRHEPGYESACECECECVSLGVLADVLADSVISWRSEVFQVDSRLRIGMRTAAAPRNENLVFA